MLFLLFIAYLFLVFLFDFSNNDNLKNLKNYLFNHVTVTIVKYFTHTNWLANNDLILR